MNESIQKAKALFAPVPHVQLGFFPTPFYKLDNMSKALGVNLYIKRDDFTGMNLFGGNKIRKLEFLLGDAVAKGCKAVVTYGATQSNHAMETVSACRRCGLKPILYLTAVVKPDKEDVRANLLLDQVMGAEIHIVDIEPGETEDDAEARSFLMGAKHAAELTASARRATTFRWAVRATSARSALQTALLSWQSRWTQGLRQIMSTMRPEPAARWQGFMRAESLSALKRRFVRSPSARRTMRI